MKKALLIIFVIFSTFSCESDEVKKNSKVSQNNIKTPQVISSCGTIHTVQTLFTSGTPSIFIGVRYDLVLDTPYNGFTKAYFILNDALNTPTTEQFFTNGQTNYVCRNDLIYY